MHTLFKSHLSIALFAILIKIRLPDPQPKIIFTLTEEEEEEEEEESMYSLVNDLQFTRGMLA